MPHVACVCWGVIAMCRRICSEKIFYHAWNTFEVIFKHENSNSMNDQLFKGEDIKLNKDFRSMS